jgi:hypothetical protein
MDFWWWVVRWAWVSVGFCAGFLACSLLVVGKTDRPDSKAKTTGEQIVAQMMRDVAALGND